MKNQIKNLTVSGMLTALSIVLVLANFAIFPTAAFLKLDFATVPILLATYACGPVYGASSAVICSLFQAFVLGGDGWFGCAMHILSLMSLTLPAFYIYKFTESKVSIVNGLAVGCAIMTVAMVLFNYYLDPLFYGMPTQAVIDILPLVAAFNIIKSVANSAVFVLIYKYTAKFIRR